MKTCIVEGCEKYAKGRYCMMHYTRLRKTGQFQLRKGFGEKRKHPLYILWHDRKTHHDLTPEWEDFWAFVKDVSPKPEGNYFLVRLRDEPYGPTNFKWQEHLKRRDGESRKEWWARKWQARHAGNRSLERNRDLKRRFGLTPEQFEELKKAHNGKCAICGNPESAVDPRTGSIKRLAVDHCHKSGKVRGLLCWDCNSCLGKVGDSIERLRAMIEYLRRHE